jgi:Xaa-Pro aminopeptidase
MGSQTIIISYTNIHKILHLKQDYVWLYFRHGTGHGIGAYLNVHEGPIGVGSSGGVLEENMFFSDEPGFYKNGEFGIRIESILRVIKKTFEDETYGAYNKQICKSILFSLTHV